MEKAVYGAIGSCNTTRIHQHSHYLHLRLLLTTAGLAYWGTRRSIAVVANGNLTTLPTSRGAAEVKTAVAKERKQCIRN